MFSCFQRNKVIAALGTLTLFVSIQAAAQGSGQGTAKTNSPRNGSAQGQDDKVDVSDLENKYWAAKDTDYTVVQNRIYNKARRFALSGMYGTMVNDPWSSGAAYGASLGYYFTDRYGFQLDYSYINSQDNKAVGQLANIQGAYPNNNKMKGYYGASVIWVPFYAKMSLLGSTIIYFDMSFALGGGIQQYQQQRDDGNVMQSTPAVSFDVTQHFFVNKYLAFRLDLKNRWYSDQTVWYRTTSAVAAGTRNVSTDTDNTTILMVGLTLLY